MYASLLMVNVPDGRYAKGRSIPYIQMLKNIGMHAFFTHMRQAGVT